MHGRDESGPDDANHRLAIPMAIIAFLNVNIIMSVLWGTFGVLLGPVQTRFGIDQQLASLAVPAMMLATAIVAPLVGLLATRMSLRLLMLIGTSLITLGFVILGSTSTFPFYLIAYGACLGPGMAIGIILPGTLVTRWFSRHRGKALGIVNTHLLITALPLATTFLLQRSGLSTVYFALAALAAVAVIANFFVVDRPPGYVAPAALGGPGEAAVTVPTLLRSPFFWSMVLVFAIAAMGSIIITSHAVSIAQSRGYTAAQGALIISCQSLAGLAGTFLFGWIADRLGGARTIALLGIDCAILWGLLLVAPNLTTTLVLVGLFGVHSSGAVPAFSIALSEGFGRESFSRAYGIANMLNLPFAVAGVPIAALIHARTGSYMSVIAMVAGLLLAAALFAVIVPKPKAIAA